MIERVLVAGASGKLGTCLLRELIRRGYATRSLVRDASRLEGNLSTEGEVFIGDALVPSTLRGVCDDTDVGISAMGASLRLGRARGGATFRDVDFRANLNLLKRAKVAGVRKFIYVSLHGAERLRGLGYVDAHEEFVAALRESGICHAIVRPTGFFYVFDEIFRMAERGRVMLIGRGDARTNPVHQEDVARACVDAVECGEREISVGGPEIYTRREIAELAFASLGQRPKISSIPPRLIRSALKPLRLFDRRLYDLFDFGVAVGTTDMLAPPTGRHSLKRYFQQLAGAGPGPLVSLLCSGDARITSAELGIGRLEK